MGLYWNETVVSILNGSEWSERRISMLMLLETWLYTLLVALDVQEPLSGTSVMTYF